MSMHACFKSCVADTAISMFAGTNTVKFLVVARVFWGFTKRSVNQRGF